MRLSLCALRGLTSIFVLCCALPPALGQLALTERRTLVVNPPRGLRGQAVTLSVQGAPHTATYRYVARVTAVPSSVPSHLNCPQVLNLGAGSKVTWQPKSGTYRLTAYGPGSQETDTLHRTYVLAPRHVMLATSQTPAQGSVVTLVLRTDDLGPGHTYQWWMQYAYNSGNGNQARIEHSSPWTTQTNGPLASYPTPIPSAARINAKVSIHRGDPCDVIAVGTKGSGF